MSVRQTVSVLSELARRRPYRGSIGNVSFTPGAGTPSYTTCDL